MEIKTSFSHDNPDGSHEDLQRILRGYLDRHQVPVSNAVKIFLSSTFSDFKEERNWLSVDCFPRLKSLCANRGLDFSAVDLRWGVTQEMVNEHSSAALCLREVRQCLKFSYGPAFVAFIGERRGGCWPPESVQSVEFDALLSVMEPAEVELVNSQYRCDENCLPPARVLLPVVHSLPDFLSADAKLRSAARSAWDATARRLRETLVRAAGLLAQAGRLTPERLVAYSESVTEREVSAGLVHSYSARRTAACLARRLDVDVKEAEGESAKEKGWPPMLDRFVEPKREDRERLERLVNDEIGPALGNRKVRRFDSVAWHNGTVDGSVGDYRRRFCDAFVEEVGGLIRLQMARLGRQPPVAQEVLSHHRVGVNKVKTFCGQEEQLARLQRYLLDEPGRAKRPLFIRGLSGMGKTSLLAQCVTMTTEEWCPPGSGVSVVFRYLGTSAMSYHIGDLLRSLLEQLQLIYGLPVDEEATASSILLARYFPQYLNSLCQGPLAPGSNQRLLLLLDSLDQLSPRDGAYSLAWLPRVCPPGLRLVFTSVPASDIRFPPDCELLELVAAMPRDTALAALRKKLSRRGRRLQESQEQYLLDMFAMCPKPIYLKVLMREALTWTSFTEPRLPVGQPGDDCVQMLVKHVFEGLEKRYGELFVRSALGPLTYLSQVGVGISEVELEDYLSCQDDLLVDVYQFHSPPVPGVLRIPPTMWARLKYDLDEYISVRQDHGKPLFGWFHRQFTEAAHDRYVASDPGLPDRLFALFSVETGIRRTLTLSRLKSPLTIRDADRQVTPQPVSPSNTRVLALLPRLRLDSLRPGRAASEPERLADYKRRFACNLSWILAKATGMGYQALMADYQAVGRADPEVRLVQDLLKLAAGVASDDPPAIAVELIGRLDASLLSDRYSSVRQLLLDARAYLLTDPVGGAGRLVPHLACLPPPRGLLSAAHAGVSRLLRVNSDTAVVCAPGGSIQVWQLDKSEIVYHLFNATASASSASDSEAQQLLASNSMTADRYLCQTISGCVRVWDSWTGAMVHSVQLIDPSESAASIASSSSANGQQPIRVCALSSDARRCIVRLGQAELCEDKISGCLLVEFASAGTVGGSGGRVLRRMRGFGAQIADACFLDEAGQWALIARRVQPQAIQQMQQPARVAPSSNKTNGSHQQQQQQQQLDAVIELLKLDNDDSVAETADQALKCPSAWLPSVGSGGGFVVVSGRGRQAPPAAALFACNRGCLQAVRLSRSPPIANSRRRIEFAFSAPVELHTPSTRIVAMETGPRKLVCLCYDPQAKRSLVRIAYLRDLLTCPPDTSPLSLFIGFVSDLPEPSCLRVAAAETVIFIGYVTHGQVEAWCARTLRRLLFINAHTRLVTGLAVDGRWLYSTSADEQLRVWNLSKAFPNWTASAAGGTMYSVYREGLELGQGRPQSPQIGVRCDLDNLATGFHLLRKRVITAHVLSPGQLVVFYLDRSIAAYWTVSGESAQVTAQAELFNPAEAPDMKIGKVRIVPSHSYAAYLVHSSAWERPQVRIFHLAQRRQIATLRHSGTRVRATRSQLIVRSDNTAGGCDCHLYNLDSLAYLRSVRIDRTPVHLIFTPDSRHAIGVNPRTFINVWSLLQDEHHHNGDREDVCLAKPLGLNMKVLTRKESVVFVGESMAIFGLLYGSICLWKPADAETALLEMSRLEARQRSEGSVLRFDHVTIIKSAHEMEIVALKVNRAGDAFASCGLDTLLKIWSLKDYSCLQVLAGHTDLIRCCHFTNLDSPLVSGSRDQTMRVWHSGRECAKFVAHTDVFFVRITNGAVVALFSYDLKRRLAILRMPQPGHNEAASPCPAD